MRHLMGQTVCEMPEFTRRANKVMTAKDKGDFIDYIAHNPKAGEIMKGTGGVRKVRFPGKDKVKAALTGFYIIIITNETRCICLQFLARAKEQTSRRRVGTA